MGVDGRAGRLDDEGHPRMLRSLSHHPGRARPFEVKRRYPE